MNQDVHPILQDIPRGQVLCFTGHRPEKLPTGANLRVLIKTLHYYIDMAVAQGYTHFYTGLADGVDYFAAEYLFTLRQTHPKLRVIGVQPCQDYREFFRARGYSMPRLEYMLANLDALVTLPGTYRDSRVFRRRNFYMVDRSGAIIAVCGNCRSGSMQTFRYAQKQGLDYCRIYIPQNPDQPGCALLTPETWMNERRGF